MRKGAPALARRAISLALACCLCACGLWALPGEARADVLRGDVIVGKTVAERDLSFAECPSIDAEFAALMDADGSVYFSRNGDAPAQIASITKVMTAIVAIDNAPGDLPVVVSERAAQIGESSANLQEGDEMPLSSALVALLVPSGNDAAVAIAEAVGGRLAGDQATGADPLEAFVAKMNEKAHDIGCADTLYENPHGLDDGQYAGDLHSTALDQAKVARCAMGYQQIRDIVGAGSTSITVKRAGADAAVALETTDLLLEDYAYAIGVKTGLTDLAGPSFMGAALKDGRELYAVVLGSSDETERFQDARNLFEWGFDHLREVPLANTGEWATMRRAGASEEVPVLAEISHLDWNDRSVKATLADPSATVDVFDLEGNVTQEVSLDDVHGTVNVGDAVGKVVYRQRNQVIAEANLVAAERVEAPNPIDAFAIWWQRLTGGFGDEALRERSKIYNVMPIINDNTTNAA